MNGPSITVVGHVAAPARARTLASGAVVADFRLATTPSRFDKATGEWIDLETLWFGVTCWRTVAEHVTQTLKKGDRVIVTGSLSTRSWKTEQGEDRSGLEIDASSVGLDFLRGPMVQTRVERSPAERVQREPADSEAVPDGWAEAAPAERDDVLGAHVAA